RLELVMQDGRTEEEKERDRQIESEKRTYLLPGLEAYAPAHYELPVRREVISSTVDWFDTESGTEVQVTFPGVSFDELTPEFQQHLKTSLETVSALFLMIWNKRDGFQDDEKQVENIFGLVVGNIQSIADVIQLGDCLPNAK
ncbi:MAG: hypothetical protein WAS33_29060, partial [Candidatus Promineifilaceae bacterium]